MMRNFAHTVALSVDMLSRQAIKKSEAVCSPERVPLLARNITHGKRIALRKAFAQCQIPLPPGRRQSPLAEFMIKIKVLGVVSL